jgi:large subunit ribosomal protein L33
MAAPRGRTGGAPSLTWPAVPLCSRSDKRIPRDEDSVMAKPTTVQIKLVSSADTGYFYVAKKNPRKMTEKLNLRKYDPVARKHVIFKESKMK